MCICETSKAQTSVSSKNCVAVATYLATSSGSARRLAALSKCKLPRHLGHVEDHVQQWQCYSLQSSPVHPGFLSFSRRNVVLAQQDFEICLFSDSRLSHLCCCLHPVSAPAVLCQLRQCQCTWTLAQDARISRSCFLQKAGV